LNLVGRKSGEILIIIILPRIFCIQLFVQKNTARTNEKRIYINQNNYLQFIEFYRYSAVLALKGKK